MKTDEIINILGKMSSQIRNRADRQACLTKLAMPDPCLIAKLAPLQVSERHSEKSPNTFSPTLITIAIALTCFITTLILTTISTISPGAYSWPRTNLYLAHVLADLSG